MGDPRTTARDSTARIDAIDGPALSRAFAGGAEALRRQADAINAIKAAAANPNVDAALLDQARNLHRKSQFLWDFVSAENSTGFHNPEYALKILAESTDLARQAQMLAAQSVNDMELLETGTYYQQSGQ